MRRINDVNPRNGNATSLANSQPPFPYRTSPLLSVSFTVFTSYPDPFVRPVTA